MEIQIRLKLIILIIRCSFLEMLIRTIYNSNSVFSTFSTLSLLLFYEAVEWNGAIYTARCEEKHVFGDHKGKGWSSEVVKHTS